ncbi:hypothetical protein R4Z10_04615 [Niallia sp. XMNu-256]|uniref:hypothetical protein n=1 Tax=Niallia sp. XMNu-256 TaxID=3082444 RepID=UPI0030D4BF76
MMDYRQTGQFFPGFPGGGGGNVERRLERLERQFDRIERQIDQLNRRVDRIERRLGFRQNTEEYYY